MAAEVVNTRYEILEPLTVEGEPFVAAKARDIQEGRVVAFSAVLAERMGAAGPTQRLAFLAAVQEAAALDHPNIARIYDRGKTEGQGDLFVVSEYLRGITLRERIRRVAPFSLTVAVDIAVAAAEALEYAHGAGVAHGDLRPEQILLSPEGQIKVGQFAYSRAAWALLGEPPTPARAAYLSPEAARGGSAGVAADVYALGVMLYEMLTGQLPDAAHGRPPSPRGLNPGVPPALEGVVQKAIHPDLVIRYKTASALLADLKAVREALRAGRSLAWSPVNEKQRQPRPASEATQPGIAYPVDMTVKAVPQEAKVSAPHPQPAPEPVEKPERDPSRAFGVVLTALFGVAVLGVIGLVWFMTKQLAVPNDVTVPNFIGKTYDDAKRTADQKHINLVFKTEYSNQWPQDQIFGQDPPSGRMIKAGRDVTVMRSLGPRMLTVPDLTGMTRERAERALREASLPLGTVNEDYSDTVQKGVILSQSPAKESLVPRSTAVNFVISKGKQPPELPTGLTGTADGPDSITLHWQAAGRADTYTVTRSLNGQTQIVGPKVEGLEFTDRNLQPNTGYTYTVNAVNGAGNSGPSEPVTVNTAAKLAAPAVLPPDTQVTPPADTGPSSNGTSSGGTADPSLKMRQFTISFTVPRRPSRQRHIQFEVQDATGPNLVYDEMRDPGDEVDAPVQGFGKKITFRIFLDGKLVKQETL